MEDKDVIAEKEAAAIFKANDMLVIVTTTERKSSECQILGLGVSVEVFDTIELIHSV